MHYLSVENLTKSYGAKVLFEQVSFHISEGDKVALVAKNGSGKSSLLKIIAGEDTAEEGTVWVHKEVNVAFLNQNPQLDSDKTVEESIFSHPHPTLRLISQYEAAIRSKSDAVTSLAAEIDDRNAWQFKSNIEEIISRLGIDFADRKIKSLSGGERKRVALAKTLIDVGFDHQHTLLLLDEPTNHLDIEMIEWLEGYLSASKMTLLLVTHDRYFLDRVCNVILEIDEEGLFIHRGDYAHYLEEKSRRIESAAASRAKAKNLYRKELEWMRRQPQARGTKAKARIDRFYDVKEEALSKRSDSNLSLDVKMTRLGGKILELKKVRKAFGDKLLIDGFSYTFKKGERVGIIGKNGAGKSTFLNIIQGMESADSGKINVGETVLFGYYAQKGLVIKEDMRVIEWVKNIAENFKLADGGVISASEFLTRFLFPPSQQYTFISKLSGGEKKRLQLLAVLFRNPNFLILDEPTNDLDIDTLQVLEEFLSNFAGCLMIVSHDRYFMNRLIDHLFVFEGNGKIRDFPGNYSQYRSFIWEKERKEQEEKKAQDKSVTKSNVPEKMRERKKLSYNEQRELKQLEKEIPTLEAKKKKLSALLSNPELPYEELEKTAQEVGEITELLEEKEMRWLELEENKG